MTSAILEEPHVSRWQPKLYTPRLIILDLFGTVISPHLNMDLNDRAYYSAPRPGFRDFADHYHGRLVLCSDYKKPVVYSHVDNAGIMDCFERLYTKDDLDEEGLKNLGKICDDFSMPRERAVFIGDDMFFNDSRAAKKYGIDFILMKIYAPRDGAEGNLELYIPTPDDPRERREDFKELIGMFD